MTGEKTSSSAEEMARLAALRDEMVGGKARTTEEQVCVWTAAAFELLEKRASVRLEMTELREESPLAW